MKRCQENIIMNELDKKMLNDSRKTWKKNNKSAQEEKDQR